MLPHNINRRSPSANTFLLVLLLHRGRVAASCTWDKHHQCQDSNAHDGGCSSYVLDVNYPSSLTPVSYVASTGSPPEPKPRQNPTDQIEVWAMHTPLRLSLLHVNFPCISES